jgi:hypothetical protein
MVPLRILSAEKVVVITVEPSKANAGQVRVGIDKFGLGNSFGDDFNGDKRT